MKKEDFIESFTLALGEYCGYERVQEVAGDFYDEWDGKAGELDYFDVVTAICQRLGNSSKEREVLKTKVHALRGWSVVVV